MRAFFCFLVLGFGWFINPKLASAQSAAADSVVKVKPYKSSIYAELGGNGIVGSVNYEQFGYLPGKANTIMAIRLGLFFLPSGTVSRTQANAIVFPIEVSMFWGKKEIKPEAGIGFTFLNSFSTSDGYNSTGSSNSRLFPIFRLGLRYDVPDQPFFWRLGFTPALLKETPDDQVQFFPWGGLGIGFKLGR